MADRSVVLPFLGPCAVQLREWTPQRAGYQIVRGRTLLISAVVRAISWIEPDRFSGKPPLRRVFQRTESANKWDGIGVRGNFLIGHAPVCPLMLQTPELAVP